ncbi:hypothetical protein LTR93_011319 [Exophiala xenobiotica]|nr:hypothetical protein LTR93_011319 [Exophiala xenobiotica]
MSCGYSGLGKIRRFQYSRPSWAHLMRMGSVWQLTLYESLVASGAIKMRPKLWGSSLILGDVMFNRDRYRILGKLLAHLRLVHSLHKNCFKSHIIVKGLNTKATKTFRRENNCSRVERKRIQDRLSQRATRERARDRMVLLKQRLSSLEAGDKHAEIGSLTRQIFDLHENNDRLRHGLHKVQANIQSVLDSLDQPEPESNSEPCDCDPATKCACPQAASNAALSTTVQEISMEIQDDWAGHTTRPSCDSNCVKPANDATGVNPVDLGSQLPDVFADLSDTEALLSFNQSGRQTGSGIAPDWAKWDISNGILASCLDSVLRHRMATTQTLDVHVIFKAVIWGWDKRVFGAWTSKAQRIALMYITQTMIQYLQNLTKENLDRVPEFLRRRPSQDMVQDPANVDFLIWPGLRDRFIFEYKKYTNCGAFSGAFVDNFHFYWPFSESDYLPLQYSSQSL